MKLIRLNSFKIIFFNMLIVLFSSLMKVNVLNVGIIFNLKNFKMSSFLKNFKEICYYVGLC